MVSHSVVALFHKLKDVPESLEKESTNLETLMTRRQLLIMTRKNLWKGEGLGLLVISLDSGLSDEMSIFLAVKKVSYFGTFGYKERFWSHLGHL